MSLILQICVVLLCSYVGVHCLLTCNRCVESDSPRGNCGSEQKCSSQETRCLAIRWGANQIVKKSNSYDTRCATADECSDGGRQRLCSGRDCEAKCCATSKCDAFLSEQINIIPAKGRTFHCHRCFRESLDSCVSSRQRCDDDQDACASFLIEGGNIDKVYTKRCARKNECTPSELDRLCGLEKEQSNQKKCQASCCYDQMCNECALKTFSILVTAVAVLLSMIFSN